MIRFSARHPGTVALAQEEGIEATHVIDHSDVTHIQPGGVAKRTLPENSAVKAHSHGGRRLPRLRTTPERRRTELSPEDMRRCGERIEEFVFQPVIRKSQVESIG